jgi:hypothetical protein
MIYVIILAVIAVLLILALFRFGIKQKEFEFMMLEKYFR